MPVYCVLIRALQKHIAQDAPTWVSRVTNSHACLAIAFTKAAAARKVSCMHPEHCVSEPDI